MSDRPPRTPGKGPRRYLVVVIALFVAALIAIFLYNRALTPAPHGGDLNSNKVEGGRDTSRP